MTLRNEQEDVTFESALERLEQIVRDLESGELPLEKAIENFQEGMKMAKICRDKLDQAEQKIEMLVKENGEFLKKPFNPEDER
ncbi:exodeoxyribonuclease 7 small subunit [Collibacillus ludicampi]|jgi:exodeoxyribonuclease VII small subunit|uniref:Exodeoxyribonuclease 7 small subunit n=1 Tax=Collibacillus ludicampi TaxID=2771369 RepID=A0AAV4LAN5_9BACL|nr:exodeoxyribonuclease VII small subunit [Collibacillus ludicampi]GIM44547.1 exodeoxyribonuclease 7 small subunit [Collibacillus ludicampi]